MLIPSLNNLFCIPQLLRPFDIANNRSLSLTLNSCASFKVVTPSALAAAINIIGNSSIASEILLFGISIPNNDEDLAVISPIVSKLEVLIFSIKIFPPIRLRISIAPVLYLFRQTFFIVICEFLLIRAATIKNIADEQSEGISIFFEHNFLLGLISIYC